MIKTYASRLTDRVLQFITDSILSPLESQMNLILQESFSKAIKALYLQLLSIPRILSFLEDLEIVKMISPARIQICRYLVEEPVENVIFENFEAELIRDPYFKIKVDVSTRVVKRRDGSRIKNKNSEDFRAYREDFANFVKYNLG